MDVGAFIDDFLAHRSEYDPVKAREYYLRTRKLKGRASASDKAKAKEYEDYQTATAEGRLNDDLKKTKVVMNKKRRIGAAEQKLIRAKSLAARIKDPLVKADMLSKLSSAEKKLNKVKGKPASSLAAVRLNPSIKTASARPVLKRAPKRVNEDEVPMKGPGGAKLVDYDGKGTGKATYSDGSTFDGNGWTKPANKSAGARAAAAAKRKNAAEKKANAR